MTFQHPARPVGRFAGLRAKCSRYAVLAISLAMSLTLTVQPAAAQSISIIRDTEIERVLRSYEEPLLVAAGIDPATVKLYLVDDPTINAFATQSPANDEAEDIFVNAGLIIQLKTPNQVVGVLAHETGHIAGGDLTKDTRVMNKAMISNADRHGRRRRRDGVGCGRRGNGRDRTGRAGGRLAIPHLQPRAGSDRRSARPEISAGHASIRQRHA